jgi:hypothetical protein
MTTEKDYMSYWIKFEKPQPWQIRKRRSERMKRFDENAVIGWLIMVPLIVLVWVTSAWMVYEMIRAMLW